MNTRHYYLRLLRTLVLAALTAAATAACSDDNGDPDGREPITPDDGIPVTFTANINPGSDAKPDTRTVLTPTDNGGFTVTWKGKDNDHRYNPDQIRIRAAKGTTVIPDRGTLKIYIPSTSAASSPLEPMNDQNKLTLTEGGLWTFTAVYGLSGLTADGGEPYRDLGSQGQLQPGNTDHIAKQDFSVATAEHYVDANSEMPPSINLKFGHKLSALQLRITNQTGEELTVKEIRLSADGGQIAYKKAYDIATGKWNTTGEKKIDYLQLNALDFPALPSGGTESQDLHMLFFPGYENETLTVTVITSRGEYSRTRPAPDGGFLAAKNYLTNIVIKTSGLTAEEKWVETISNKAELIAFRDKVNNGNTYAGKTVRLTADIDLANETWTTPIGNSSNDFRGTFDGGGYHISDLNVDTGSEGDAGLFGYITGGTVRNLRVSGNVTTTGLNVGGIAGYLEGSTVENCIFDGEVSGNGNVGGIAGLSLNNSRIAGCHTKGKLTASGPYAGGIIGLNDYSTIDGCYSEAEVTADNAYAGGIAGQNVNGSTVTHCYATGSVSAKSSVGGIAGYEGTVTDCIALNPGLTRTAGNLTSFGRIVGRSGTVTSCAAYDGMTFTDANGSFDGTGEAGTDLPAADCLTAAAYTSRDFTEATATTPGWAFDPAAPWTYLPWNPAFASFPGITDPAQYRIPVPAHLTGGGTN